MAKKEVRDSQILQKILMLQGKIDDIFEEASQVSEDEQVECIVEDAEKYALVYFYGLGMISLLPGLHTKSVTPLMDGVFNKFKNTQVTEGITKCYPTVSKKEYAVYFRHLSDTAAMGVIKERYIECIGKSANYTGGE